MATKHMGCSNPRNFKEKIELLKLKEAACTANFMAAMQDVHQIRQNTDIDRSLSKAYSLSDLSKNATKVASSTFYKSESVANISSDCKLSETLENTNSNTSVNSRSLHANQCVAKTDSSNSFSSNETNHDSDNKKQCNEQEANYNCISLLSSCTDNVVPNLQTSCIQDWTKFDSVSAKSSKHQPDRAKYSADKQLSSCHHPAFPYNQPHFQTQHPYGSNCDYLSNDRQSKPTLIANNLCSPYTDYRGHEHFHPVGLERNGSDASFQGTSDWRRSASDSSIYHRLNGNVDQGHTTIPVQPRVSMLTHQPNISINQTHCYDSQLSQQSLGQHMPGSSASYPHPISEAHLLPAKRVFLGGPSLPKSGGFDLNAADVPRFDSATYEANLNEEDTSAKLDHVANDRASSSASSSSYYNVDQVHLKHKDPRRADSHQSTGSHSYVFAMAASPPVQHFGQTAPNRQFSTTRMLPDQRIGDIPPSTSASTGRNLNYLDDCFQFPNLLTKADEADGAAGRRDSCTMTAEVLSSLNQMCNSDDSVQEFQSVNLMGPPTVPPSRFAARADELAHSSGDAVCMQNVSDRIGISITPNDYRLLTDPQLANYVTDQETEAQLID